MIINPHNLGNYTVPESARNGLCVVIYSHSTYFDCLDICISQLVKYKITNFIIFADKQYKSFPTILYDNEVSYSNRLLSCLKIIQDNYIILLHEDFILYDYPKLGLIQSIDYQKFDSVRLIRSGVSDVSHKIGNNMYKIISPNDYHFCIQSSIFKKSYLEIILQNNLNMNIWDLEIKSQNLAKLFNNIIYWDNTNLRGLSHYDSTIFPYTATAINKGKWNKEYFQELSKLHFEYQIDSNKRGWA